MEPNYDEPVAYDRDGHPLYRHPTTAPLEATPPPAIQPPQAITPPAAIAAAPSVTPTVPAPVAPVADPPTPGPVATSGSEAATDDQRHEASVREFPTLNLSEGEYVIAKIERAPIGIVQIWAAAIALLMTFWLIAFSPDVSGMMRVMLVIGFGLLSVAVFFGVSLIVRIYRGNKFYLTNESVIQETQSSLFAKDEQTVSLGSIEDVSYKQPGFLASTFDYGTLQLTTEGEETNYRFTHVENPKKQAALVHNQIEKFKKIHGE